MSSDTIQLCKIILCSVVVCIMGGENWKATDVLGEYANSPWRGNKGLKHGNRGEETGARDAWMILLGLLETFTMLVF